MPPAWAARPAVSCTPSAHSRSSSALATTLTAEACYVIGNVRARGNDLAAGRTSLERALGLAQDLDEPSAGGRNLRLSGERVRLER